MSPTVPGPASGPIPARPEDPVRAVFRTALRDMLVLVAVLAVVGIAVGALVAGTPGVWGAVIAVGLTVLFSGTTVVTMLRTATAPITTTAAVVLGAWLVKMLIVVVVLAVLDDLTFYDRTVLVVVLVVGVLGSVVLDYRAVSQGRVPYVDPAADRPTGDGAGTPGT